MPCTTPPMTLAIQQQRVDHLTDIVGHDVTDDPDHPGGLLDLDFADMTAIGKSRACAVFGDERGIE